MNLRFFSAPRFESEEDNFRAKFINGFAWLGIVLLSFGTIRNFLSPSDDLTIVILPALIVVLALSLYLLHQRRVAAAGWIIIAPGWLGIGLQAYSADGVKDTIILAFIAIGLLASITISRGAGTVVILASIAVIAWLSWLEATLRFQARVQDPIVYGTDIALIFVIIAMLIYFSTTSLRDAIQRATASEAQLRATNESLQELNLSLEERVAGRTAELQAAYKENERRARQFEAITQVTHAISSVQGIEELFQQLTEVISEKFDFYHVGIFLLDENREFAILRAANSEGGRKMITQNHRLRIGHWSSSHRGRCWS
jgi:glucan phosphoethanolaminetransferase (alkaline phosphatase superfamily)